MNIALNSRICYKFIEYIHIIIISLINKNLN